MNKKLLYFLAFFGDLMFFYPFYNVMFYSYGMSQLNISLLIASMQFAKMLSDIPGGLLFDKYGKNLVLVCAQIFKFSFLLIWVFFKTKISFFLGMIIWGISNSFMFGNTEAYIYASLEGAKKSVDGSKNIGNFRTFLGKYYSLQNVAILVGSGVGSLLFLKFRFNGVLLASAVSSLISFFILVSMHNVKTDRAKIIRVVHVFDIFLSLFKLDRMNFMLFLSGFHEIVFLFFIDLQTNFLINAGFGVKQISFVVASVSALKIATNFIAGYFVKYFRILYIVTYGIFIFLAFIPSVLFGSSLFTIGLIITMFAMYSFIDIAIKTKMQTILSNSTRGTVMSTVSLISSSGVLFLNLMNAILLSYFQYSIALSIIGGVLFVFAVGLMLFYIKAYKSNPL